MDGAASRSRSILCVEMEQSHGRSSIEASTDTLLNFRWNANCPCTQKPSRRKLEHRAVGSGCSISKNQNQGATCFAEPNSPPVQVPPSHLAGEVKSSVQDQRHHLNCLATHLLRCLVPLSMSTDLAFKGALPVLSQR